MVDKVLYFPYINAPNTAWFTRVLLYWEKAASIVPYDYVQQPQQLDPYMRELVAAGLIEQVIPAQHIHRIPDFSNSFLEYVHEKHRQGRQFESSISASRGSIKLHIEKIDLIADELVRLGLAELIDYPWYNVEAKVANSFMAYLALTLGRLEEVNAVPITHNSNNLRLLSGTRPRNFDQRRRRIREVLLAKILPSPNQPVELYDLINFKERYGQMLRDFRRNIESICIEIANLEDLETMEEQIQYKTEELEDAINEIKCTMRNRWHRVTMGTLVPVIGAGASLLATPINPPLAVFGAGVSLAGAAYQAFANEAQYQGTWNKPLAYAALAQSHLLRLEA